jgi:hypothetical protein
MSQTTYKIDLFYSLIKYIFRSRRIINIESEEEHSYRLQSCVFYKEAGTFKTFIGFICVSQIHQFHTCFTNSQFRIIFTFITFVYVSNLYQFHTRFTNSSFSCTYQKFTSLPYVSQIHHFNVCVKHSQALHNFHKLTWAKCVTKYSTTYLKLITSFVSTLA